jgi:hypothetical protein
MSVAQKMIERFGGHQELADELGVNIVQVYRWTYPKERKGTNGMIPARHFPALLAAAKRRKIKIKAAELIGAA